METSVDDGTEIGRQEGFSKGENMSLFSKKEIVNLDVTGMHCEKCVARVTEALEGVEGVTGATVRLEDNAATIEGHGCDVAALVAAVEAAGFGAALAE